MLPKKLSFQTKELPDDLRLKVILGPPTFHKQIAGSQNCTTSRTTSSQRLLQIWSWTRMSKENSPRTKARTIEGNGHVALPKEQNESVGTTPCPGSPWLPCRIPPWLWISNYCVPSSPSFCGWWILLWNSCPSLVRQGPEMTCHVSSQSPDL